MSVVGAVLDDGLDSRAKPTIYLPYGQAPAQLVSLVVRTHVDDGAMVASVKRAIWSVDPNQPIFRVRRMDDIVAGTVASKRVAFILLTVFAGLAVTLATAGIYSVTTYGVRQRTREIGVRGARGARRADNHSRIIGRGMRDAVLGITLGTVGAAQLSRALASLLLGVAAVDPLTFVTVFAVFLAVTLLATAVPAWRASGVAPVDALADR